MFKILPVPFLSVRLCVIATTYNTVRSVGGGGGGGRGRGGHGMHIMPSCFCLNVITAACGQHRVFI